MTLAHNGRSIPIWNPVLQAFFFFFTSFEKPYHSFWNCQGRRLMKAELTTMNNSARK